MSIPVPHLDDRTYAELVDAAVTRIRQVSPEWTDLSVHDPGIVVVEAFAHLTDMLMYRLNRVPDRLYAVYLNLLGTALRPASAAEAQLHFTRADPGGGRLVIPRGTRVTAAAAVPGAATPVFATLAELVLPAGESSGTVLAADVTLHDAVIVGVGTGLPGQEIEIADAPLVSGDGLTIGIEVPPDEVMSSGSAVSVEGRTFRICREVEVFADTPVGEAGVRVDRAAGRLVFPWWADGDPAPPVVPGPGAQVRAWYRTGGGERGNVAAGKLRILRDPRPGLSVSNPEPATGGRDLEPLDEALQRAPQDFQARDRAVTARDYEVLAGRHGGVARARALTRREVWAFAAAGEVEVVLVPHLPEDPEGASMERILAHEREDVRTEVAAYLAQRATIGASPSVRWGRYKQVAVEARVVVRADEDPQAVRQRILDRLARAISPMRAQGAAFASGFGRPLRISNLYRALEQAEPGVLYVDRVEVVVDRSPDEDAVGLTRAQGQPSTWFVAQEDTLFRTTNGGDGWEACAVFAGERVRAVSPFPGSPPGRPGGPAWPGMVAVATQVGDGARIQVSQDLGESWTRMAELGFAVADLTWVDRAGTPTLLMAGEKGLYELQLTSGAVPVQNLVDPALPDRGFYAVDSFVDIRGRAGVVVAAEASAGVWLSADAGLPQTFAPVRGPGDDVRCMAVQYDGPSVFLWIGRAAPEGSGSGCARLRIDDLTRTELSSLSAGWEELGRGWTGGSCWGVDVIGDTAHAATQSGGVVHLQLGQGTPTWEGPDVNCGLPLRDRARFAPVRSVTGDLGATGEHVVLAAGPRGVVRSVDGGASWRSCADRRVNDVVTVPPTWLFCSGEHKVEVVRAGG